MRFFTYRHSILFAPNDPPDGGSGGGGGSEEDNKLGLSEEQQSEVGRIVNAAVASHLKRLNVEGKVKEALQELDIAGQLNAIKESLKQAPQGKGGEGEGEGEGGSGKGTVPPELAKQFAALEEKLETEKQARLAAEKERQELHERHLFESGRQKLYESLKSHADPDLHDVWVDHLVHNKRFRINEEDGVPELEVEYSPHKGLPKQKDFLALEDAIPHLVQAAEMKRFMAVADTGDGARKRGSGPSQRRQQLNVNGLNSDDPLERTRAQLAQQGIDFDAEFGG